MPMGDELRWQGGERIFESCDISLEKTPTSHGVYSLALVMYACSDSAMLLLSCACLYKNSKLCLPSFYATVHVQQEAPKKQQCTRGETHK